MPAPDRYAVIGNPIGHSKSPRIHTLFAAQTGQDMTYEALLAPLDGFTATVRDFIAAGGRGMNVTVPFKEEAFRLASHLSERARAAGAVNTLTFAGGEIRGDNTDGAGLVRDITTNLGVAIAGRRALLVGAGGAARGVILPLLAERPAALTIVNRTADKAHAWPGTFRAPPAADSRPLPAYRSTWSSTPLRPAWPMPNCRCRPVSSLRDCLAYDMVYGRETPFLRQARAAGATGADGLGMLVEQAAEAFLIWRGIRPHTDAILETLRRP